MRPNYRSLVPVNCGRIVVLSVLLAWGSDAPRAAAAERIRIAIPAILGLHAAPAPVTPDEQFQRILGTRLRELMVNCKSIEIVSQGRCDAIMSELMSPARRQDFDGMLPAFRRFQPVDAIVHYELTAKNRVVVHVMSDAGVKRTDFDAVVLAQFADQWISAAYAAAADKAIRFIAQHLPVTDHDREVLTGATLPSNEIFSAAYLSLVYPPPEIWAHRPEKPYARFGMARVYALVRVWKLDRPDPLVASAAVRAGHEAFLAMAQPVDGQYRTGQKFLDENALQPWMVMIKFCFEEVLGTPDERYAYPLARLAPGVFIKPILELAKPVLWDSFMSDDVLGLGAAAGKPASAAGGLLDAMLRDATPDQAPVPRAKRLGALRVLGQFNLPEATAFIGRALADEEPDVREAAALAAGELRNGAGVAMLRPVAEKDAHPRVAFAAGAGLWKAGAPLPPRLIGLAKTLATDSYDPLDPFDLPGLAVAVLADQGGPAEIPLLRKLAAEKPSQRKIIVPALLKKDAVEDAQRLAWLSDSDEAVIQAVLTSLPDLSKSSALRPRLEDLANDPFPPIAARAIESLARHPPKDPWEVMALELKIEHPYIRERILEQLAADSSERATLMLAAACDNSDTHVRTRALRILADRDPNVARSHLEKALMDPAEWVSFHAAALAPRIANRAMIPALNAALELAGHSATRLYLREALAKAGGGSPPPEMESARLIAGDRNLAWAVAPGLYTADSPFDAYYCMDTGWIKNMRNAHNAGKVLFARAMPLRAPAQLIMNRAARDTFIPRLDKELSDEVMTMLDGVIYGEETMEFERDSLWEDGWRMFCREVKIDPDRIEGQIDRLNSFERHAWNDWTRRINIAGFNKLSDFTKLRYGRLRPGLQVGSFQFGGPEVHCDFSGVYDYKGDNRLCAYDLVRSSKTICPERPVLWLSLGIGGYEMNPVRNTTRVPAGPMLDTYDRSWSDSITAWLAGAETGWFSTWMFINPLHGSLGLGGLRGKQVWVEDIGPASPILSQAIDYAHEHVKDFVEDLEMPELPDIQPFDLERLPDNALAAVDLMLEAEKQAAGQEDLNASLAARKEQMTVGFLYYQQYVYDCARILASMPRQRYRAPALVNRTGVDVWTRPATGQYPRIPAQALLNRYDYLYNLNDVTYLDLSGYRLFITHHPTLLKDATIRSLTQWLRDESGLLVVHRFIPAENDAEVGTVDDFDGVLHEDWPWEEDIRITYLAPPLQRGEQPLDVVFDGRSEHVRNGYVASFFDITGPRAVSLATVEGKTVLALWRDPARFKGAVLFDGLQFVSSEYLNALRSVINSIHRDYGIGMRVEGPALLETLNTAQIKAAAATRYYNLTKETVIVPGLSAMGYGGSPAVGRLIGSTSGLTLENYAGRFVAASETLSAVADRPFEEARLDGSNLILKTPGVVRVYSRTGGVSVETMDGRPLPVFEAAESGRDTADFREDGFARWRFIADAEGVFPLRFQGALLHHFRSTETVVVKPVDPPPVAAVSEPGEMVEMLAIRKALAEKEKTRRLEPVKEMTIDLGGGAHMAFVKVEALGVWMGKYETTNQEFQRWHSEHTSGAGLDGERQPAVNLTYDEAVAFAEWVNQKHAAQLPPGFQARLPKGNEWVTAAQCGDGRKYPWGDNWPPEYGNYFDTSKYATNLIGGYRDGYAASCPVEESGRNEWGLYGMGGNVSEWTAELTEQDSEWRIRRGAYFGWEIWGQNEYDHDLRCVHRAYAFPNLRHYGTGVRLVIAPREKPNSEIL